MNVSHKSHGTYNSAARHRDALVLCGNVDVRIDSGVAKHDCHIQKYDMISRPMVFMSFCNTKNMHAHACELGLLPIRTAPTVASLFWDDIVIESNVNTIASGSNEACM